MENTGQKGEWCCDTKIETKSRLDRMGNSKVWKDAKNERQRQDSNLRVRTQCL